MYTLSLHIEYLLLRHDCVVVPGIGAFINVRHSAWYDAEADAWHPMTREVRFNPALRHDDGLLANSYARKEQTGFQEGRELSQQAITEMQRILAEEGELTLGHLGTLRRNEECLSFLPRNNADQMAEAIGFSAAPIRREKTAEAHIAAKADANVAETADVAANPTTEPLPTELADSIPGETTADVSGPHDRGPRRKFDPIRNYYIAVNKIFARAAACFALVAAVSLSVLLPVSDCKREDRASVVPVESILRKVTPAVTETAPATPEEKAAPVKGNYHLIVATFANRDDAEVFMTSHAECGYRLSICETKTRCRVSALTSSDRGELEKAMRSDSIRTSFKQAWIWKEEG